MTISFAGKGGVGKTTICSLFSIFLDTKGFKILCIDADPDANLCMALGTKNVKPLSTQKELLQSIANNNKNGLQGFYELNVKVEDVVENFGNSWGKNSKIITLGWSKNGGEGCYCVENSALSSIIRSVDRSEYDYIIIDGEAGLEHLSRGVFATSDVLVLVYQMGKRSIQTARDAKKLAYDLGVKNIKNAICGFENDELDVFENIFNEKFSLKVPYDKSIRQKDILGEKLELTQSLNQEFENFLSEIGNLK